MDLEKLFLKKEELPIKFETCFQIPIHPKLLNESLNIDENLAKRIFPGVAKDWYTELTQYVQIMKPKNKEHIERVYLKEQPKIKKYLGGQLLNGYWQDDIQTSNNGLVTCFSINRNAGGSLYLDEDSLGCRSLGELYIKFDEEKTKEFEYERIGKHSQLLTYAEHNVDNFPGALFLRNWAIKYMNEVFKEIFKE